MKKLLTLFVMAAITFIVFAQSPQKMSYQAVIRDAVNNLVTSHAVGMRISILQGSATGTEIYKEIYNPNPQTNANGLVSIEIGGGIPLTGSFSTINWAAGPFFLKTETDPTGGTNYTISGTSQLLSVPYALYSTTAQTADYNDLSNRPTTDGSETKIMAGTNITVTGSGTTGSPYLVNAYTHFIGESYGGGIVFYVYDNGQHGLIAAIADQGDAVRWYAGTYTNTIAKANGVGAGKANTAIIMASQGDGDGTTYAARICNEYSITYNGVTYGDWYLPSEFELNLLYLQRTVVGGFINNYYWSSTEYDNSNAWLQVFIAGDQGTSNKYGTCQVRAIRAF